MLADDRARHGLESVICDIVIYNYTPSCSCFVENAVVIVAHLHHQQHKQLLSIMTQLTPSINDT